MSPPCGRSPSITTSPGATIVRPPPPAVAVASPGGFVQPDGPAGQAMPCGSLIGAANADGATSAATAASPRRSRLAKRDDARLRAALQEALRADLEEDGRGVRDGERAGRPARACGHLRAPDDDR